MLQLLTLLLALQLLMLALLFAPGALFGLQRMAIRRQNRRDAGGGRHNVDSRSGGGRREWYRSKRRHRRIHLDPACVFALAAHSRLRCRGGGRHGSWLRPGPFAQLGTLRTLRQRAVVDQHLRAAQIGNARRLQPARDRTAAGES